MAIIKRLRRGLKSAVNSSFSPLIKVGYGTIVSIELTYELSLDKARSTPCTDEECHQLTGVIKTFERPNKLLRLLRSIRRTFPTLQLIVVDDSRVPVKLDDIEVIELPFDSGVSAGRAAGLERVTTPYVINLDDDFIFTRKTKLTRAVKYLNRNSDTDLVAGEVAYLPYYIRYDYSNHQLMNYHRPPIYPKGAVIDGLTVYEKCANFFVARTEKLREVGWDPQLKRLDHADFYTRAYGRLVTVFDPEIELLHTPTHFDQHYLKIRHNYSQDAIVLNRRYEDSK
ncbi:MAG: glycosyltransferase [Desulfobacteraceae bacterium]|jgi:glycosyltransferase involved in cell wall biosynthesis|nr:glycosyltransferase [Desulfobacteraceae bacterium]